VSHAAGTPAHHGGADVKRCLFSDPCATPKTTTRGPPDRMRAVPLVAVHAIRARRRGRALLALPVAVSWAVLAAGRGGRLGKSAPPPGVEVFDAVVSSAGPGWAATSGRRPSPQ